ncbi:MAG: methionyl-tRNA formyltransferase [Gammaproteobacteria bacterium]|nr:methionyl-tRNA formyltransferase [Gammaproteobacteria bacterium]|tara:strand:- start:21644 stop:22564 length:921 start_codon:yes stop_codon:yes gene_type:complete
MDILFAGTPNSSANILKYLIDSELFNVTGVITQPDKKGKRGNKLIESSVSALAKKHNICTFKPKNLENDKCLDKIKAIKADYLLVIAYGNLLPRWLIDLPEICSVNVHFSLLPKYRGASPIQAALLNGDTETGITFMKISDELDAGNIISSNKIIIDQLDNKVILEQNLTSLCIDNILGVLNNIPNRDMNYEEQDHSKATYCSKIKKQDSLIDFNNTCEEINNKFRAYFEWPGLNFLYKNILIKIKDLKITDIESDNSPGSLYKVDKTGIYLNTMDKVIVITYLQFPNKSIISSLDAYNSYKDFFN